MIGDVLIVMQKFYPQMEAKMSKKSTEEHRIKISISNTGKIKGERTKEVKDKISFANSGCKNGRWKGGIRKTDKGYIKIHSPKHPNKDASGYVAEHRLNVEMKLGRYLLKSEKIHHINLNKKDNRIENLMLFKNDSEHISFHNKIRQFGMTRPILRQIKERFDFLKEE